MELPNDPVLFSVSATEYRVEDVVHAAKLRGEWAAVEQAVRDGLACERRVAVTGADLPGDILQYAARDFRYARGLIAGQEMDQWLRRWGMFVGEWMQFIHRDLLRAMWADDLRGIVAEYPVDRAEIDACVRTEAVCSGDLMRLADTLAGRLAVYERARQEGWVDTPAQGADAEDRLAGLEPAFETFRERMTTTERLEQEVGRHRLDWMRFEGRCLRYVSLPAAREAALCFREDHLDVDEVARRANAIVHHVCVYLEDLEEPVRDQFLGCDTGKIFGPVPWRDHFAVVTIEDKRLPSLTDPEVRRRAEERLLARDVGREVEQRVTWHLQS